MEDLEQEHERTSTTINRLSRGVTQLSDQMTTLEETFDLRFNILEDMLMNQNEEQEHYYA